MVYFIKKFEARFYQFNLKIENTEFIFIQNALRKRQKLWIIWLSLICDTKARLQLRYAACGAI